MQLTVFLGLLTVAADVALAAQHGHAHGLHNRMENKKCRPNTQSIASTTSVALMTSTSSTTSLQYSTTTSPTTSSTTSEAYSTTTSSASTSSSSTTTSSSTTAITTPATTSSSSSSTTATTTTTTTTTAAGPVVTDEAYIDTILRHHNVHRANSSAGTLLWSPSLAETARKSSLSCFYQGDTTTDGGGYGQTIGAGFQSTSMGAFITEGLYNSEVNSYTYYGGEPDYGTFSSWGDFSQIVWRSTTTVGCYTNDCSATGLQNAPGIPPYFTICNYSPAGNAPGAFSTNVLRPLGFPSIDRTYGCTTQANPNVNCVGATT